MMMLTLGTTLDAGDGTPFALPLAQAFVPQRLFKGEELLAQWNTALRAGERRMLDAFIGRCVPGLAHAGLAGRADLL
jgi:hypothetical protein